MKTLCSKLKKSRQGFTLTELLIASGLATVVLTTFMGGFVQHRKTMHQKNLEQELQQNVRTAMMFIQRDLRYAGSGMVMGGLNLNQWFGGTHGMSSSVTTIPWITDGGGNSDQLLIVGVSGEPVATLSQLVFEGDVDLYLDVLETSVLPYIPQVGDVLVLAGLEAVVVNAVESESHVRVSRDPTTANAGVHLIYPEDTEVYQLNVVRYRQGTVEGVPTLFREDSRFTYANDADRVIADGIELFKVSRTGNLVEVQLHGRSRHPVAGLPSDTIGDGLLRYSMTSSNRIRNVSPQLNIQGWPSDALLVGFGNGGGGGGGGGGDDGGGDNDGGGDDVTPPPPTPTPAPPGNSGNRPGKGKGKG